MARLHQQPAVEHEARVLRPVAPKLQGSSQLSLVTVRHEL